QALANVGISTSMIAHEVNNILTPLPNYAALARTNPDDRELAEKAFSIIERNSLRAIEIIQSILAIVNGETREKQLSNLTKLVSDIFDCLSRDFSKDGITVKTEIPEDMTVWGVPVEIQQVLMNLILNSRDSMLGVGGILTIRAEPDGDNAHIIVSDTGSGIEKENLDKIFEPFFTTKRENSGVSNSGSGLGLAFCKQVVEEHGGSISVQSGPESGTVFSIILPSSQ
ncbi:MAG: sensor histidine kinase, partial [Planctomycetota bacterium]